jgi:CheY-like chemotaxis protein
MLEKGDAVDTLVTDMQMPGLNGFEVARRARSFRSALTILCYTGHPELCGDMGPALGPVVSKPCTPERLRLEIARLKG